MTIRFRKGASSVPGLVIILTSNYGTSGSSNAFGTNGNISGGSVPAEPVELRFSGGYWRRSKHERNHIPCKR